MKRLLIGIVAGAILAVVALFGGAAIAGTGIGAVFNLGETNTVNKQSVLTGASNTGPLFKVTNTGTGTGSTAMNLQVPTGLPPFVTNGTGKVLHLQADTVDGQSASDLQNPAYTYTVTTSGGTGRGVLHPSAGAGGRVPVDLQRDHVSPGHTGSPHHVLVLLLQCAPHRDHQPGDHHLYLRQRVLHRRHRRDRGDGAGLGDAPVGLWRKGLRWRPRRLDLGQQAAPGHHGQAKRTHLRNSPPMAQAPKPTKGGQSSTP